MKKLLIASLCSAFVLGACALVNDENAKPKLGAVSGILINVKV